MPSALGQVQVHWHPLVSSSALRPRLSSAPTPSGNAPETWEQQVTRSSERDSLIKGFIIKAHGFPGAAFLQPGRWALSLAGSLRLLGSGDELQGSLPQEVSFPHEGPSEP